MRAIIFINGMLREGDRVRALLRADDRLIGADGGTRHILALGRMPDLVVGDLDSIEPAALAQLHAAGVPIERHPVHKDQTDLELAIECALRDGAGEIVLVAATGGRLDHTLANVLILAQRPWPVTLRIVDSTQEAVLLRGPTTATLNTAIGASVSALPLSESVTGITYQGLAYPLENATLALGSTRGVSNVAEAAEVTISIASGLLLVVNS
jgi:thiamine pyrophosphokinase